LYRFIITIDTGETNQSVCILEYSELAGLAAIGSLEVGVGFYSGATAALGALNTSGPYVQDLASLGVDLNASFHSVNNNIDVPYRIGVGTASCLKLGLTQSATRYLS
jgi:hypothetical protein